jgi:O-antigen ligase
MSNLNKINNAIGYSFAFLSFFIVASLSIAILINNVWQLMLGNYYFSTICFVFIFIITLVAARRIAFATFIFFIPLLPNLSVQLATFAGISFSPAPMVGVDFLLGYFLAIFCKHLIYVLTTKNRGMLDVYMAPWPINALLLTIVFSVALAIYRNTWSSASSSDFYSFLFNASIFRGIGWFDDLRPLTDLVSYLMAGGVVLEVFRIAKSSRSPLPAIFRPLLAGLFLSGILALIQSKTGLGYEKIRTWKDIFGYAPYGFQPDLHAYAGYTLLGAIGLWGYYYAAKVKSERFFILVIVVLSWYGLIASISKSTIFLATLASTTGFFWLKFSVYKKRLFFFILFFTLFLLIISFISRFSFISNIVRMSDSFNALYLTFVGLNWSNINDISAAFSNRPGIWLAALGMWAKFPLFGVGQGNFYQLSHFFNFINVPDLINGENAHNYFLQTLAETGLVGVFAFTLAILTPFFLVKDRRVLMPAAVALFSLFLGNIFAHSFLVRENLFLAAVFVGLMYSYVPAERLALSPLQLLKEWKPKIPWNWILPSAVFIVLVLGAREIYTSFYKFPFQYGSNCWINRPVGPDGWTSGLYEVPLPVGSHGLRIPLKVMRPNLGEKPLGASFSLVDSKGQVLATQAIDWKENGPNTIEIALPNGGVIRDAGVKASLKLSSCYTPRNLGESADGRRLGVMVDSPIIY